MRQKIKNASIHYGGSYEKIAKSLENEEKIKNYAVTCNYITIADQGYPPALLELSKPPFILYYEGDICLVRGSIKAVVGSRQPSLYSLEMTEKLVVGLREKYTIISGLALGIDAHAHYFALDFSTIAVLGCGLDVTYPFHNCELFREIRTNHLLLSEYPPGTPPRKHHFPFRNRLIAALANTVYVMSARQRSGTMTTVNEALILNRNIVALPHPLSDETGIGCNILIKEGADILTEFSDL